MTREEYERMRQAALDLIELAGQGAPIAAQSLQWAREVLARGFLGPPVPGAHRQSKVLRALEAAPPEGLTGPQVAQASGVPKHVCAVTLCYMVKHQQAYMVKIPTRSRFFATREALELGRPLVEAEERERAAAGQQAKPKPKPAKPPKPPKKPQPLQIKPKDRPRMASRARRASALSAVVREQGAYTPEMLPEHVRIVELPSHPDRRYTPEPPIEGIGALAEWMRLTRSRRKRQ